MDDLSTKFQPSESVCIEFLCSFQNVLQMVSSALKAHLHTSCKIVNDSHTFLLRDFPDLCYDCCLQFTKCLRIVLMHIILEIPPQIKIWGVQVWCHLRTTSRVSIMNFNDQCFKLFICYVCMCSVIYKLCMYAISYVCVCSVIYKLCMYVFSYL